ncbi:MAG: exonuclease subunit SbcD [Bacteroidetes bacterium]|nr:MAG: exonuclease subunit SbcD [Bacteroidota bacterium]
MKLLHTADWHLGKRLEHFSRLDEQRAALDELCRLVEAEDPDVILIAGDLYDQINPPVEATELLYQTLHRMADGGRRAVVGIAGNHDAPDRIEAPDPLARACGIILLGHPFSERRPFQLESGLAVVRQAPGFVELKLPRHEAPLRLLLTPYANEVRLRRYLGAEAPEAALRDLLAQHWARLADTYCDETGVNVLMAHLFVVNQEEATDLEAMEDEGEKSVLTVGGAQQIFTANLPPKLQYVALGHLHGFIPVQTEPYPVLYSSSLLPYSLGDRQQDKQVVIVEAEPGRPATYRRLPLQVGKKVLRQRFESVDEGIDWLIAHPDCLVECVVKTDEHLTAQDRKRLLDAHAGILKVIPEFSDPEQLRFTSGKQIDLSQRIEVLFDQFFAHKHGTPPNEELKALFREVIQAEDET